MSFEKVFWPVLLALFAFEWLHPSTSAETVETAFFLREGRKGQDDYLDFYKLQYSADRATQTVVTYGGVSPHVETNCSVLSTTTWQCDGKGADDGELWYGFIGRPARHSVGRLRYYVGWLLTR